jgi:hypothetical protein
MGRLLPSLDLGRAVAEQMLTARFIYANVLVSGLAALVTGLP